MLTEELRIALGMALERAAQDRHEFITLEHMLLGLLHDPSSSEILEACGANLAKLEGALDEGLAASIHQVVQPHVVGAAGMLRQTGLCEA